MITRFNDQRNAAAFNNRQQHQKKDRPFCTHCNMLGHVIDKCFKLHGYPPGYKNKGKTQAGFPRQTNFHQGSGAMVHHQAHQVSIASDAYADDTSSNATIANVSFTPAQCQQLLSFMNTQMISQSNTIPAANQPNSTTSTL